MLLPVIWDNFSWHDVSHVTTAWASWNTPPGDQFELSHTVLTHDVSVITVVPSCIKIHQPASHLSVSDQNITGLHNITRSFTFFIHSIHLRFQHRVLLKLYHFCMSLKFPHCYVMTALLIQKHTSHNKQHKIKHYQQNITISITKKLILM